jgi:hypothetical protein
LAQGLVKMIPKSSQSGANSRLATRFSSLHDLAAFDSARSSQLTSKPKNFDLNELMNNSRELEMFKQFLESQQALNDLLCWMDIEAYTRIDPNDVKLIEEHARMLKRKYLNKKYLFSNNSPIDAEAQNLVKKKTFFFCLNENEFPNWVSSACFVVKILEKIGGWNVLLQDVPPNLLIILAKKHIEMKLKLHWLPAFYNSEFSQRFQFNARTQMKHVVDDVLYLKSQFSPVKESVVTTTSAGDLFG